MTAVEAPLGYAPAPGRHDDLVDRTGALRSPWRAAAGVLGGLDPHVLARAAQAAERLIVADGARHLLHDAHVDAMRPWALDPLPIVLDRDEWRLLARGIAQRAELAGALVADLNGARRLLHDGVLPVEAVAGHAAFLHSRRAAGSLPRVVCYAADVVRLADGSFAVLRDLTDAPSGDGYALLSRSVLARVVPDAFARLEVASYDGYLGALLAALDELAPPDRPNPRTVLLHGQPDDRGHVEHVSLATRVGVHAVEPVDLTVRGGRVWLQGLEGLEPVDVVWRRVSELQVDPLERGGIAGPGVPGLLEVARRGQVGLANGPSAAVAGHLAVQAFLPSIARALLGADLVLPGLPTTWLGDPAHRAEALADLERVVLFDANPAEPVAAEFGDELDAVAQDRWRALIDVDPTRYVAQEKVAFGTTPAFVDGDVRPVTAVLRLVAVAGPDGVTVLPGGHARVIDPTIPVVRQQSGWGKDIWVLDRPGEPRSIRRSDVGQIDLGRSVSTRAAEAMWWIGRNAERAETGARVAAVVLRRMARAHDLGDDDAAAAVAALRASTGLGAHPVQPVAVSGLLDELAAAGAGRAGSIADSVGHLVTSARTVREFLSSTTWRVLAVLDLERERLVALASQPGPRQGLELSDAFERMLVPLAALAGLGAESVVRGPAWRFLDLGRRCERALGTMAVTAAALDPTAGGDEAARLELVLASCDSLVAYRRRHRTEPVLDAVGGLILGDPENPRSVRFQLEQAGDDVAALPHGPAREAQAEATRAALAALEARLPLPPRLVVGPDGSSALQDLVDSVGAEVRRLVQVTASGWFAHPGRWR